MSREAMKQPEALRLADALDAEFVQGRISNNTGRESAVELRRLHEVNQDLLKALHEALETEQEPVAWMHNFIEGNVITHIPADIGRHPERWTALYKNPTPCKTCESLAMAVMNDQTYHEKVIRKREWVGLTADEIWKCNKAKSGSAVEFHICYAHQNVLDFAESIESKLKEKNT